VLAEMKPGDFVLIQFGHNDGIAPDDPKRPRGTLRGTGEETREITHPQTKQQEVVHTFGWYMRKYARDARAKGATPIICSYVPRCPRPGSPPIDPEALPTSYSLWAKEAAEAENVPFIDLHGLVLKHYATMTPERVKDTYFSEADYTHTNATGARRNAEAVVEGLRALKDVKLNTYLAAAAR
jgi:lysophospholipase L1-like esterase